MFSLSLSDMMEHGKGPPLSWQILLSNRQAQTELHSIRWPLALIVLSKLWPRTARAVSNEVVPTVTGAILATV